MIEKQFINLIDNDSLKTTELLDTKTDGDFGVFNFNTCKTIDNATIDHQHLYNLKKLNYRQSFFLGNYEAKKKHLALGWKLGGFASGCATCISALNGRISPGPFFYALFAGQICLTIVAYHTHPEPARIPFNADKNAYADAYEKKARIKNGNRTYGIIGSIAPVIIMVILFSQINISM